MEMKLLFELRKNGFAVDTRALSVEETTKEIARIFGK